MAYKAIYCLECAVFFHIIFTLHFQEFLLHSVEMQVFSALMTFFSQILHHKLSILVFQNLTKLKRLNLDGNRLTALPLLPSSLQELKVNDNNLQELSRHSFRGEESNMQKKKTHLQQIFIKQYIRKRIYLLYISKWYKSLAMYSAHWLNIYRWGGWYMSLVWLKK